jgi:hypothetical protein
MRNTRNPLFVTALGALVLTLALPAVAADSPLGTFVKKPERGKPEMTLTIDEWGPNKAKLTYRIKAANLVLTILSNLDGRDADVLVNGKPSGETMAIKLIDKRHSTAVVKMNGKQFGTSKASFSDDYKTLTVDNDFTETAGANEAGHSTEIWLRR